MKEWNYFPTAACAMAICATSPLTMVGAQQVRSTRFAIDGRT
jgi:hypothetical protein